MPDGFAGVIQGVFEEVEVVVSETVKCGFVEEVAVVFEEEAGLVVVPGDGGTEVEFGAGQIEDDGFEGQAGGKFGGGGGSLRGEVSLGAGFDGEGGVEDGLSGEIAPGVEPFHEQIEGVILMGECVESVLAHALEVDVEGGIIGEVGAQDESVDEEADELRHLRVAAPGQRAADEDVRLPGKTGQEELVDRQQEHEGGDLVLAAAVLDLLVEACG